MTKGWAMLLSGYSKELFRPECNPSFESVHCRAVLNEDVSQALPYLNAVLGGFRYFAEPPAVMFRAHGKIIKVGAREIAVNALADEDEADRILAWLMREINEAWENRRNISPKYDGIETPQVFAIFKLLPRTNCRKCGLPTCLVFAARAAEGVKGAADCPEISPENGEKLAAYLSGFDFGD